MVKPIADRVKVLLIKSKAVTSELLDTSVNKQFRKNVGEVEEVGPDVQLFKKGDIVYFPEKKATFITENEKEYALISETAIDLLAS